MSRNRQTPSPATPSGSHVLEATENESAAQFPRILRLRAEDNNASSSRNNDEDASNRRIRWSEDVVDNEGMGKKKSKVCCIYHKPRPVGESSSESESDSSSSDSDSDSETDHQPRSGSRHSHPHNAGSTRDDDQTLERGRATCCAKHHSKEGKRRKPSPNAYEKMPTPGKSHTKSQGS